MIGFPNVILSSLDSPPLDNVNVTFHQTPSSSMSPMITLDFDKDKVWHLVKPADHEPYQNGVNERKMMAEIYLPRLLTTKVRGRQE